MVYHTRITPFKCYLYALCICAGFVFLVSALLSEISDVAEHGTAKDLKDKKTPFPGNNGLHHLNWFVQVSVVVVIAIIRALYAIDRWTCF